MKFINIGFGNMVSASRIVAIAGPDSAPIKRLVQDAKEDNRVTMLIMNLRAIVEDDIDFLINFISENFSSDYKKGDLKQVIIDNPL